MISLYKLQTNNTWYILFLCRSTELYSKYKYNNMILVRVCVQQISPSSVIHCKVIQCFICYFDNAFLSVVHIIVKIIHKIFHLFVHNLLALYVAIYPLYRYSAIYTYICWYVCYGGGVAAVEVIPSIKVLCQFWASRFKSHTEIYIVFSHIRTRRYIVTHEFIFKLIIPLKICST